LHFAVVKGQNIIILILAAAGLFFGRKFFTSGRIQISIIGLDLRQRAIKIELINPTNTSLQVSAFVASLTLAGQNFATLDYRQALTITATDRKVVLIPIRLNPINGAKLLAQILYGSGAGLKGSQIDIDGTINSEGLSIPVKTSIPLQF
jgi:hypothetical protein